MIGIPPLLLFTTIQISLSLSKGIGFDFSPYKDFVFVLSMLFVPQLIGTGMGLFMLKEQNKIGTSYIYMNQKRRLSYIVSGLIMSAVLTFLIAPLFLASSAISMQQIENLAVLILLIAEAPIYVLLFFSFNVKQIKMKAIVLRSIGFICLGATGAYLIPEPWQWLTGLAPTYWPSRVYLNGFVYGYNLEMTFWLYIMGLLIHVFIFIGLFVRCAHSLK